VDLGVWELAEEMRCGEGPETTVDVEGARCKQVLGPFEPIIIIT